MCSVVGCDSFRRSVKRFKLPEDPEKRLEWVQFVLEVNGQRLKESSWTEISICCEHFKKNCFENITTETGKAQLKSGAVPSLSPKPEADGPEVHQESQEATEPASHCEQPDTCESGSSEFKSETNDTANIPQSTELDSICDYGQMLQKIVNIEMIKEKVTLLRMKGEYIVNENQLLQLFSSKCPSCGSKIKVERVVHGAVIVLNQQCLQCDYKNQWHSQLNDHISAARQSVSPDHTNSSNTGVSEIVAVMDEETESTKETEEPSGPGDADSSDGDWHPLENENESTNENNGHDIPQHKHSQLCPDCGKFFRRLHNHTCEHKTRPFACNICGKRCVSEVSLNCHSRVHDVNYEHHCKYCHVTFKTKVDKVAHEQIHITQGKPYKCPDCSKRFATSRQRADHLEEHRGPIQLKCHICGIQFARGCSLQRHLVVHTGEKPFKCPECQRGFNQASHLKSHMRLHTGERPYKCEHCDKSFNHNVSLKSHLKSYHSSSPAPKRKKKVLKERESYTGDARSNKNGTEVDTGLGNGVHETEQEVQTETTYGSRKRRSLLRSLGRANSNTAEEVQSSIKNTAQVKTRKSKRKCYSDKGEDEPLESDASFDSVEEEEEEEEEDERSEKLTPSGRRSRGGTNTSDSDSDFDPAEIKKTKRNSRQTLNGSKRQRGGKRKNELTENT